MMTDADTTYASREIGQALTVLFDPGMVIELRAFKRWTVSGYFEDTEALKQAAAKLDAQGYQIYVTINEVDPALLAR